VSDRSKQTRAARFWLAGDEDDLAGSAAQTLRDTGQHRVGLFPQQVI
jgi:hypothetical protein